MQMEKKLYYKLKVFCSNFVRMDNFNTLYIESLMFSNWKLCTFKRATIILKEIKQYMKTPILIYINF